MSDYTPEIIPKWKHQHNYMEPWLKTACAHQCNMPI